MIDQQVGSALRVLVVDDDPVLRLMTSHMLKGSCSVIETAESVDDALRRLADAEFDVVVSDYLMPGRTGLALVETCAERSIGFILLSGIAEDDYADDHRYDRVQVHLTKPVSTGQLLAAVRSLTGSPERLSA